METLYNSARRRFGTEKPREETHETGQSREERVARIIRDSFASPSKNDSLAGETLALGLGVKPAVWFSRSHKIEDPRALEDRLRREGMDFSCNQSTIVNNEAIRQRVLDEPVLAREVGWDPNLTPLENFEEADLFQRPDTDSMRAGFILGIPGSAIRGYQKERRIRSERGNVNIDMILHSFLTTPMESIWWKWAAALDIRDRYAIVKLAAEKDLLDWYLYGIETTHPGPASEAQNRFYTEHEEFFRRFYAKYTTVTEQEASFLLSRRAKRINAADGSNIITFVTYGEDGRNAPDVRRLEAKIREAFRHIKLAKVSQ